MRYCPSWIAYECLRILSQTCFQRRPIASMTHLAVSSRGRFWKTCGERRRRRPRVGPGQRRRGRPGGEGAREGGADGLARPRCGWRVAAGVHERAAMGRLWRSYERPPFARRFVAGIHERSHRLFALRSGLVVAVVVAVVSTRNEAVCIENFGCVCVEFAAV